MNDEQQYEQSILLGQAMGWTYHGDDAHITWTAPDGIYVRENPDGDKIFNPFTDANDDYAVLEWVRAIEEEGLDRELFHMRFATELCGLKSMYDYRVGDYARAALTVVNSRSTNDE